VTTLDFDFMFRSTAGYGNAMLLVASLADIIKSKRSAGRPKDHATLSILDKAREEAERHPETETSGPEEGQ
jgi:hypothetical protein